ncbi:MAG: response regulator transcription factor [Christensenellaceae bacterium]
METLLIADDETDILQMLRRFFERRGYFVLTAENGREAVRKAEKRPDLILLDVNMPDMDGFAVCESIRSFVQAPILFLTARIEDADKVRGFALGGDDYIVKPFSLVELGARVEAHLRREKRRGGAEEVYLDGDIVINYTERTLTCKGTPVALVKKEFDVVEFLSRHPGQVFDKDRIYEQISGFEGEGDSATVTEYVRRIRAKLSVLTERQYIETVWGVGYKWIR